MERCDLKASVLPVRRGGSHVMIMHCRTGTTFLKTAWLIRWVTLSETPLRPISGSLFCVSW
jgi:hypothetical protein